MTNHVWRLQTITLKGDISGYCLKNNIAALGWSLLEIEQRNRESITTFDDFEHYADSTFYSDYNSVKRFATEVQAGDLLWIRSKGKYYLGRFGEDSNWKFVASEEATGLDASNQRNNIKWYSQNEADESVVPGAISTAFIAGSAFQRIRKSGVFEYSALLYDELSCSSYYKDIKLDLNEENFYSLLSPEDCEDLLCMWLYKEKGYICIPSTNKIATPLYECVLIDPKTGRHIYTQVKKGKINIDASKYSELDGEVWLFSSEGRVENFSINKNEIYEANPKVLYEFALAEEFENIIPPNIKTWVDFLADQKNQRMGNQLRGIMFDTNRRYSDANEIEMIKDKKISAYGAASRYIKSFRKGDYALFYSKGKGIIAVGRIKDENPTKNGDELYHNVEPVVFPDMSKAPDTWKGISASEIKKILGRDFYFASTIKVPFINEAETKKLTEDLLSKQ